MIYIENTTVRTEKSADYLGNAGLIGMTENNITGGLYLITEALKSGPPSWLAEFYSSP
jgi:hypothetical protein